MAHTFSYCTAAKMGIKEEPEEDEDSVQEIKEEYKPFVIVHPLDEHDYNGWVKHYHNHLSYMYQCYVSNIIPVSYSTFTYIAYLCSKKEFNEYTYKKTRPLV